MAEENQTDEDCTNSFLICGESGDGKSTSLRKLAEQSTEVQKGVLYFNCEGGKPLPFKNRFKKITIDDPLEIFEYLQMIIDMVNGYTDDDGEVHAPQTSPFHTIIIDTISFMMNRYESVHVIGSANTMAAWGNYGQFFPQLMYDYVAKLSATVIMLGHLEVILDEDGTKSSSIPVKGALAKNGLEAYFTTSLNARKISIKEIEKSKSESPLLNITDEERDLGFKHVFQTRTTGKTVGDRIRSPFGLWSAKELYIDNDAVAVMQRLKDYYDESED